MSTALIWHERYMWHDTGNGAGPLRAGGWLEPGEPGDPPASRRRFKNLMDVSGLTARLDLITPEAATREEIGRCHSETYIARIERESAAGAGDAGDGHSPFGSDAFEVACLAAGGAIAAVDATLSGRVVNAYALVRPPGHHAGRDGGMGFCIFNNCAIAAEHALRAGVARVAIVDIDVHHGNGTQALFYASSSVLTISIHQDGVFPPRSGSVEEQGEGDGAGFNLNIPLPPGSGNGAYEESFDRLVLPALDAFRPELVIVASGLDANGMDTNARQMLYSDSYRSLTERLMAAAGRHARGRLAFVHEGGYNPAVVPFCGLAIVETLSGICTAVVDPFIDNIGRMAGQDLQPHQRQAIAAAESTLGLLRARCSARNTEVAQ